MFCRCLKFLILSFMWIHSFVKHCIYSVVVVVVVVFSMNKLREQVKTEDAGVKKKQFESGPKASHGYGGQFGVENEKMDKVDFRNR